MKTTLVKLTAACALAFAMASGAQAQILADDPFLTGGSDYAVGGVSGQGPAVTGFNGNWFADANNGSISATPISYSGTTGYETTPGSGALINNNQDARNGRALDPSVVNAFTATSGIVYMSFLMQLSSVGGYQAVELGNNSDGGRFLQVGYSNVGDFQNSTDFGITLNASGGGGTTGSFAVADANVHLFVIQLNLTSGTDTLNAWEDPTNVTGGVVTGGTEVSLSGFTVAQIPSNFLLGSFLGGSAGTEVSDVRIGETLSDVTVVPSEEFVSLTPANTTLFDGSNAVLTLTIPQAANASGAVTVTMTNNNPGVVSLQGAVGNVLTVTFPAGATNAEPVVVTGVGGGQATLTYASPGLVTLGSATINVLVGISLTQITGGDSGEGFAPLPVDVGGVDFGSSIVTIQGVTFTNGIFTGENGITTGTFPVPQSFGFGSTPDDNSMSNLLSVSTFAYTQGTQYSFLTSGDQYDQYQFTGLTVGKTYQVDIFTVCDAIPRPTLTQVVGATTNAYIVETETSPQDVVYDMTPDTNGDITVEWSFGSGAYTQNSNGNSGCVGGIALTTQSSSAPTLGVARSGSSLVLTWSAGGTLLQSTNLLGPWTTNINTSPYTVTPTGPKMFFRVQAP